MKPDVPKRAAHFRTYKPKDGRDRLCILIATQRRRVIPRFSGMQGVRDDRQGATFAALLDCEAIPNVGDLVVTRWSVKGALREQVDRVETIAKDGTLHLSACLPNGTPLKSRVTTAMLEVVPGSPFVLIEGIIRGVATATEQGEC